MKLLFILIAFIVSTPNAKYIELKPTKAQISYCKLKWTDFKVKQSADNTVSESVTAIGYNYDGDSKVDVFCTFDRNESYVVPNAKTDYILNHEQRHFDITYIYAVKFVNELKILSVVNDLEIEKLHSRIIEEKGRMQDKYDNETENSENRQLQSEWDVKIEKLLINL